MDDDPPFSADFPSELDMSFEVRGTSIVIQKMGAEPGYLVHFFHAEDQRARISVTRAVDSQLPVTQAPHHSRSLFTLGLVKFDF